MEAPFSAISSPQLVVSVHDFLPMIGRNSECRIAFPRLFLAGELEDRSQ